MLVLAVAALLFSAVGPALAAPARDTTYVVQRGDTLFKIAVKFGVSMQSIITANAITNPNLIFVGQTLTIPGVGGSSSSSGSSGSSGGVASGTTYRVKAGDNLYRIAAAHGVSVQAIMAANNITNPNLIFVGSLLIIPGQGSSAPAPTATPRPSGSTSPSATATSVPASGTTGGFELGGQVAGFSRPDLMQYAGMNWVKRQVRWAPGARAQDQAGLISDAHGKGFKILLSVVGASADATPGNFPAFAQYAADMAALGADGIEVWNEMNIDREWPAGQISPASYTSLLAQAYNAIKARNSGTLVISGAPAPTGFFGGCSAFGCDDAFYVSGMVSAGALNYMDCLGIHYNEGLLSPYVTSGDPRGNPNHYTRYYQTMVDTYYNAAGGKKKLCFTELGYLSGQEWGYLPAGFLWKPPYNLTVAEHAQYLGEAYTLSKSQGKTRLMIVFNVDFTAFGDDPQAGYAMIRRDGTCPACDALAARR